MSTAILFVLLLQPIDHHANAPNPVGRRVDFVVPSQDMEQAKQRQAAYQARLFAERFNHLVKTIEEFAEKYNQGHTIDIKKLKALKKAWRDLEQNEPWFGRDKTE